MENEKRGGGWCGGNLQDTRAVAQWQSREGAVGAALDVQFRRLRDVDSAKVTSILVERRGP